MIRIRGTWLSWRIEQQAYGWSPDELHFQHPYLTLEQIHSTLACYWDHREELDRDIQRRFDFVTELLRTSHPAPLAARLKTGALRGGPARPVQ